MITTIHPASRVNDVDENIDGNYEDDVTYSHVGYDRMGRKWWEAQQTTVEDYIGPGDPDFDNTNSTHVTLYKSVNTKEFEYDITGRLTAVVLPLITVDDPRYSGSETIDAYPRTEYVYDSNGDMEAIREKLYQLKRSWEVNFNASTDILTAYVKTTTFAYDCMHRQLTRTMPGCGTEYKHYDDFGRLDWELDFKEQLTGYFYDSFGRLEDKKYYAADTTPGDYANSNYPANFTEVVHYTYDNLGRKETETVTDYTGTPTVTYFAQYSYDDEGQLEWIHVQHDGQEYKLQYVYSPVTGRKTDTKVWKPDGQGGWIEDISTDYSYDELGRLNAVTANKRNGLAVNEQTSYNYDLVGNRKSTTLPNGVYTEYAYNAMNRLTDLIHYQTTAKLTTISSFNYKLNAQGMRIGVTETLNETRHLKYAYDNLNRLINEYSDNKADSNIDDPTPPIDIRGYKENYVYDLVGNRQSRTVNVRNDNGQQELVTTCDYYPGTDRLWHEYQQGPEFAFQWADSPVYVYASNGGGWSYQLSDMKGRIGSFGAFALGLPTEWSRWFLISLMVLLPVVFLTPAIANRWSFPWRRESRERPTLSIWHRCLCILLSYIFLIGPECFQMLAHADTQYSQISTASWGSGNRTIEYEYDANGSVTQKITTKTLEQTTVEDVVYEYNLQNKLSRVTTTKTANLDGDGQYDDQIIEVTNYRYNPDGIRTKSEYQKSHRIDSGTPAVQEHKQTNYLIDSSNHTGYAQVLQEIQYNIITPSNPVLLNRTDYVLGDDIISQTKSTWSGSVWTTGQTQYLLYDGHGSTRQLVNTNLSIQDAYSYDGYGVMLGSNTEPANNTQTSMLYCGEQYDKSLSQYYLRARYYNPLNGLFNQVDPYSGNTQDPQSLHKYTYVHANPVNAIDPNGMMSLLEVTITSALIGALIGGIIGGIDSALGGDSFWSGFGWGALFGGITGAAAVFLPMTLLVKSILGGLIVASTAIGAISSFMNGNYLQGIFRILVGLISLGLLIKAPRGPSLSSRVGQINSLKNLGFTTAEAKAIISGNTIASCVPNPGGQDTVIISQFVNGRLRVGIISIENTSGTGARSFGSFRTLAFNMAKALGLSEVDLFGATLINSEVEAMLVRQGFRPETWIMSIAELEGLQEYSVYVKTFKVQ